MSRFADIGRRSLEIEGSGLNSGRFSEQSLRDVEDTFKAAVGQVKYTTKLLGVTLEAGHIRGLAHMDSVNVYKTVKQLDVSRLQRPGDYFRVAYSGAENRGDKLLAWIEETGRALDGLDEHGRRCLDYLTMVPNREARVKELIGKHDAAIASADAALVNFGAELFLEGCLDDPAPQPVQPKIPPRKTTKAVQGPKLW